MTPANWKQGDRKGRWGWWVEEGGYTADEPELYASFRHFYDPKAVNGVTYLTDHLQDMERYYTYLGRGSGEGVVNPHIDAREWAIAGPARNGLFENEYSWKKGVEYMREAFQTTAPTKDRTFVKAWRALGETMHLMGDMSCVPHVRNDSHPALAVGSATLGVGNLDTNQGLLRSDPYETLCREAMIERNAGLPVEADAQRRIAQAKDPMLLFYGVAGWTQDNFFSADTISGQDAKGRTVKSANGNPDYPSPKLSPSQYDARTGYYTRSIGGKSVRTAHETWLGAMGWGTPLHATAISLGCVEDQASLAIPVALESNRKLLDWFVPRVEVKLTNWDANAKVLTGTVTHKPHGPYTVPLTYNAGRSQSFNLRLDGSLQDWDKVKLQIASGRITADLSRLKLKDGAQVALELELGGLVIRSNDLRLGVMAAKPKVEASVWTRYMDISFHCFTSYSPSQWRWTSGREGHFGTKNYGYQSNGIPISQGGSFTGSIKNDYGEQTVEGRINGNMLTELKWKVKYKSKADKFDYEEKLEATFRDLPWNETNGGYWMEFIDLDNLRPIPNGRKHVPELKHEIKTSTGQTIVLTGFDITRHGVPRGKDGGADLFHLLQAYRPLLVVRVYELDQKSNPRR